MPFIKNIQQFQSLAIVGMAKNTGKTTCLNYVIKRLQEEKKNIALTSIGVDGEERDVLYDTPKPRIILDEGIVFVTSEKDFAECEFPAEILSISERSTPLGRLITARAKGSGKVVISGPSDSAWLQEVIAEMPKYGVDLTLVDGALSRMSLASPAVTDAMILCTGAACSSQLPELIRRTKFRCELINLEQADDSLQSQLQSLESGVWKLVNGERCKVNGATPERTPCTVYRVPCTEIFWKKISESVFTLENFSENLLNNANKIFVSGAVTDDFFKLLNAKKNHNVQLIVNDFTKLFITPLSYDKFTRNGGQINVLQKAKLLAVCTNPTSPEGANLNAVVLREEMEKALEIPVYDVVKDKRLMTKPNVIF
ncbi:MAG: hypothetical protein LBP96_00260 [Bacteroidales bacterium]|jgi:hypothetical protein|nr:hypothetical protein [Bacteroidales bacterium]